MKREELLKVFPCLGDEDIQDLPTDLVVCWYPSSGSGRNYETYYSGYNAIKHWHEQPSQLKPNLFIFSDLEEFDQPINYNLVFTLELNIEKIKGDDVLQEKMSFDGSLLEGCDEILLGNQETLKNDLLTLKHLTLLEFEGLFFLLAQTENEFIYSAFVEEGINIPLLTLNRPCDNFIFNNGIDIKKLGIQEFIAGHGYVSSLTFGEEFKKHPDFVFQTTPNEYIDLANLYSHFIN